MENKSILPSHFSKREKFFFHNSLLCLVKALENRYTTIDLRNEISLTGKIVDVDGYMNIQLSDAAIFDSENKYRYYPNLYLQARNIVNVHIPDNISVIQAIKSQIECAKIKKSEKKVFFKQSRAKRQHQETIKLIQEMKNKKNEVEKKD